MSDISASIPERERRVAAVALVVSRDDEGDAALLLVRRATYPGDPWSGHIALPGGRREPDDISPEYTARRETLEETAIDLSTAPCVAALPAVSPKTIVDPAVIVRPFVFLYSGHRSVHLSAEIAEAWWMPIPELRRVEAWQMSEIHVNGVARSVRGFPWREHIIWGITERILTDFFARDDLATLISDV